MKNLLLSLILLWSVSSLSAQDEMPEPNSWFDLQFAQSFGLNDWNRIPFASDRLPRTTSSTDLRATYNIYIVRPLGFFCDMGVDVMPAPRNGLSDPAAQAALTTGIPYYTKEVTMDKGYQTATSHFKMTFGLFGNIPTTGKLSVWPYFGVGFMTMAVPTCESILKEHNSNMQHIARYQWFEQLTEDTYGNVPDVVPLTCLVGRLRFVYHTPQGFDLLLGLEYTWFTTRADFSETYTNYFNHNIVKTYRHEGNRLHMLGMSVGVSFPIHKKSAKNGLYNFFEF